MTYTPTPTIFDKDAAFHAAPIQELRARLRPATSAAMSDHDCLRFLRARQGAVTAAVVMVEAWQEWRHTLLEPLPPRNSIPLSPNILLGE
jgi:hypothetical protein